MENVHKLAFPFGRFSGNSFKFRMHLDGHLLLTVWGSPKQRVINVITIFSTLIWLTLGKEVVQFSANASLNLLIQKQYDNPISSVVITLWL